MTTLYRLTSLRAFAALAVFAFHVRHDQVWNPGSWAEGGFSGVALFFVLSGFVLAWTWREGQTAKPFWRRRFARVWPSHAFMLGVACLVPTLPLPGTDVSDGVLNVFLVQAWFPDPATAYGFNGVAWSLSCEAFFYLTFPAAIVWLSRAGPRRRWWLIGAIAIPSAAVQMSGVAGPVGEHFPPLRLGEFVLGIGLALAVREGWTPRLPTVPLTAALVAVPAALALHHERLVDPLTAALSAALIVGLASRDLRGATGVMTSRPFVYAGEVSFAFYLVHELVLVNLPFGGASGAALGLLGSVLAAMALHHGVERPCQARLTATPARSAGPCPPRRRPP